MNAIQRSLLLVLCCIFAFGCHAHSKPVLPYARIDSHPLSFAYHWTVTQEPLLFIERIHIAEENIGLINKWMGRRSISVRRKDTPETYFLASSLLNGDTVSLNPGERFSLNINFVDEKRETEMTVYPFIGFRKADGKKIYGLLPEEAFASLHKVEGRSDLPPNDLLEQSGQELTLVYVLCPRNRVELCSLTIKKNGEWVRQQGTDRVLEFKVLAQSVRPIDQIDAGHRVLPNGDTPQGIYGLWATMFSDAPAFGRVPRIDIDMSRPPINGDPYSVHSLLLEKILPKQAWNDYWVNELPLAYALGRYLLRVHANGLGPPSRLDYELPGLGQRYNRTHGCINAGTRMQELLDVLIALGVFDPNLNKTLEDGATWNVSPQVGRAFLILRDVDRLTYR